MPVFLAYLGIRTDGQCVARWRAGRKLGFYSRRGRGQIPYAQITGFSADDERPAVRQQFYRSYVVITLLQSKKRNKTIILLIHITDIVHIIQ